MTNIELRDDIAKKLFVRAMGDTSLVDMTTDDLIVCAFNYADAFMEEKLKRDNYKPKAVMPADLEAPK